MKLAKIEEQAGKFKNWLKELEDNPHIYKYENLINFRRNWDIEALDFYNMFDASFKSRISNTLWGGSVNSAKSVMLRFIESNPEYVRSMFRDLYNENKDLSLRINRFSLHCDEMMDQLPKNKTKPVEHRHNPKILSVYLSFNDPQLYTIVDYPAFQSMMNRLENLQVPMEFEMERIFKLSRALHKTLCRDAELVDLHTASIPEEYRTENNMLMVHDFYTSYKFFKTY